MNRLLPQYFFLIATVGLVGCGSTNPSIDTSTADKIKNELRQASREQLAIVPEAISSALLPPLSIAVPGASSQEREQRFDLVINNTQVNKVFMAIVSGTRYSMLVHPNVKGKVSVNLKDVTVVEALDVLREFYGYDYKIEGTRVYVLKPGLQTKIYKVNYITGIRRGSSDINVTSGSSSSGGSGGGNGGNNNGGGGNNNNGGGNNNNGGNGGGQSSATNMSMTTRTDFWSEMEDSVRTIIGCGVPGSSSQSSQGGSSNNGGSSSGNVASDAASLGPRERGKTGCPRGSSVLVNPMSGTLLVRAQPMELRTVESMLKTMQAIVERQVILEAKIIDVELNSGAQQGINWAGFKAGNHVASLGADTASFNINQPLINGGEVSGSLGSVLGTSLVGSTTSAFSSGMGVALQLRDFSALLNFLQTQGTVNVLSSPRISTINNQKAVLKVGRDEQFVTGFQSGNSSSTTTGGTVNSQATPIYSTYFSGISLDVTPQIDEEGNITLHVHPLISEVTEVEKKTINNQTLPFASNKISETDSIVKVRDGQIVVIGGLMTDKTIDSRSKVPLAGSVPLFGSLFRNNGQQSSKRELVIMIKPTVVKNSGSWAEDIAATLQRIENMDKSSGSKSNR